MHYTINPGHSFLDSDGSTKTGGQIIELSEDVARAHADKVSPVEPSEAHADLQPAASQSSEEHY